MPVDIVCSVLAAMGAGKIMRAPKGLHITFDCVKGGRVFFDIRASKYYLFKTILKIAWQNIRNPATSLLIALFAFYYLVKNG